MGECKMTYADGPCDNDPEHFVTVSCTNSMCRVNREKRKIPLCTACLKIVMQNESRSQCHECGTGMTKTSPPEPIGGMWKPHGIPDTTLHGLPLPDIGG